MRGLKSPDESERPNMDAHAYETPLSERPISLIVGVWLIATVVGIEMVNFAITTIAFNWTGFTSEFDESLAAKGAAPSFASYAFAWCSVIAPRLAAAAVLIGLPAFCAAHLQRANRWPRIVFSSFAILQLFTMFEAGIIGFVVAALSTVASCLLWLRSSRRYAQARAAQQRDKRPSGANGHSAIKAGSSGLTPESRSVTFRSLLGRPKSLGTAYALLLLTGVLGCHKMYLRRAWVGVLYALTYLHLRSPHLSFSNDIHIAWRARDCFGR